MTCFRLKIMSPHPEIQEAARDDAVEDGFAGGASIVIAPVEAAAMKLFPGPFDAGLAQVLRRGEGIDVETLLEHLASVGDSPDGHCRDARGVHARGGILDVVRRRRIPRASIFWR